MNGIRECTVCGCTHLSDEVVQLRVARTEAILAMLTIKVSVPSDSTAHKVAAFWLQRHDKEVK